MSLLLAVAMLFNHSPHLCQSVDDALAEAPPVFGNAYRSELEWLLALREGCEADEVALIPPLVVTRGSDSPNRGMGADWERWRSLVAAYFPADQVDTAVCVIRYESGGNPEARNTSSGAAGLFQIMPFWWDHYGGDRYDPETNTAVARLIWNQQGWGGWAVHNRGLC